MEIKADIASEVIAFIREETGFKTIVCDTSGTIIAAAETSRIGNIHSGSRRMMRENLSEVVISREEEELSGRLVREGVNLPIIYDGQVLGTYGIGGEPTIVRPVAKIAAGLIRNAIQDEETRKIIIEQSKRLKASNTTSATTDEDQPVLSAANHDLLLVLSEQVSMSIERNRLESDLNEKLYLTSRTDVLTGLYNRRHMSEKIEVEFERFRRTGDKFSLIIADIDNFKNVNDIYGHAGGDFVLKALADEMRQSVRAYDIVCRWGGEEFLCLLPETNSHSAVEIAERMRRKIEGKKFPWEESAISVTVTFGVAMIQDRDTIDNVIIRADKALYQGKQSGRNRVTLIE